MWYRLLVAAVLASPLGPNELVMGCGGSESDGLYVSSMNLWLKRGEPGVAFGLARGPATPLRYGYVLLLQGDPRRRTLAGHNLTSSSDGRRATGGGYVEINGSRAEVAYRVEVGPELRESLAINGKAFDLSSGRVFLVDHSVSPPRVRQFRAELPKEPTTPRTTADVDRLARELISRARALGY
jgi:hypothetical protein